MLYKTILMAQEFGKNHKDGTQKSKFGEIKV